MKQRGASLVEYIVVVGAVALAVLGGFTFFSSSVEHTAKCFGSELLGKGCGPKAVAAAAPTSSSSFSAVRPMAAMTCGPMGCAAGSGNCFVPGTLVSTERGLVAIEDITVGERVWAERDGKRDLEPVTRLFVREDQPLVRIAIESPEGKETLRATGEHPFFVVDKGFVIANELAVGDRLSSGAVVISLTSETERSRVHNFEVGEAHTYFVGRAGVLVHNQCAPPRLTPDVPAFTPLGPGGGGWGSMGPVIQDLWKSMAGIQGLKVPPSDPTAVPYDYTAGWGAIRSDFYGFEVQLPPNMTPEQLIFQMQNDPHGATGNSSSFSWWVHWGPNALTTPPPANRPVGSVVDLQIRGDHGGIMYISNTTGRPGAPLTFTVVTVSNDTSGSHPVSGYRTWGVTPIPNANPSPTNPQRYVVWTAGIDSANTIGGGPPGAVMQEMTWNAYIAGVQRNLENQGGRTNGSIRNVTVTQPSNVTPTNTAPIKAPDSIGSWRPNAAQENADNEIRRYFNSCTSDRRNCSGEVGRYARELYERDQRRRLGLPAPDPFPNLGDLRRPGAAQNIDDFLRRNPPLDRVNPRDGEAEIIRTRGERFYRDHGAAPGSCRNCH